MFENMVSRKVLACIEMPEKTQVRAEAICVKTAVTGGTITEEDIERIFSSLAGN
ncbi:hypothetical protein [Pelagibaculum spongiae]|uniref:hypothetical protein n=1 Tax=Pelagibaculum spongiae TaxID=2080658 RepID=UPI0013149D64|nr:hypothetical protein [Pelagibaculum spongiae]